MTELVVGGGVAGGALAARLAHAGRHVVLFERDEHPVDKVCGEFLSHEALGYLVKAGVDVGALGAIPIHAVHLAAGGCSATVPLPFPAASLSRKLLDEALLARAAEEGADVRHGAKVRAIEPGLEGGYDVRLADGSSVTGKAVFLATGKHDVRGHARPSGLQDDLVAFKIHYRLSPLQTAKLAGLVELVTFRGGYAGLQPVEHGVANLCLLVKKSRFVEVGSCWEGLRAAILAQSPHLAARLAGATALWPRPLSLSNIPYGHVRRKAAGDGLWRLGDQAAVIPSFSGDGMSIALHSAAIAATIYLAGDSVDEYQERLAREVRRQVLLGTALSHALVRGLGQGLIGAFARLFPSLVSAVASYTRLPGSALSSSVAGCRHFVPLGRDDERVRR